VAADIQTLDLQDTTPSNIPLRFTLDKAEWLEGSGSLVVSGTVENVGSVTFENVQIVFSVKDMSEELIVEEEIYLDDSNIEPGQVGAMVNKRIDCEGQEPYYLEYRVVGKRQ
jgi:hypothetical protein